MSCYLEQFVRESNKIEGILRDPTLEEIRATQDFLDKPFITVGDMERLVSVYAPGHILRRQAHLNVRVGSYTAPAGGPDIEIALESLLYHAVDAGAYRAHVEYEKLHPFTDGNGRSGRALWAWVMQGIPSIGFLHTFYYQTLSHA